MKKTLLLLFITFQFCFAQKVNKLIKEKEVKHIVTALTADAMNGRSAYDEQNIFKAAAFIEKQFKDIGLKPLTGNSFLQEFTKDQIVTDSVAATIDGEKIPATHLLLLTESKAIKIDNTLPVNFIKPDPNVRNKDQYFFNQAFRIVQDTASSLVLVSPEFENNFNEFKGFLTQRFARGRKGVKVFVLGKSSATSFSISATQKMKPDASGKCGWCSRRQKQERRDSCVQRAL